MLQRARFPFVIVALASFASVRVAGQVPDCQTGCVQYAVVVTPWADTVASPLNSSPDTAKFTVLNDGSIDDDYTLTCSSTGGITCVSVSPAIASLNPGQSTAATVVYNVGSSVGTVKLTAAGQARATASSVVTANPTITIVAPVLTSGSRAVVRNRQPLVRATFATNGSPLDTTKTVLKWRTDTVTTLARANRGLIEWEPDSARWLNVGDSAQIAVTACAQNGLCTTATRWAVLPNDSTPVLGFTGFPLEALGRQFTAPFGPGLTVTGADVETGFGTPAYYSMGRARSAGLVYSTRQSYPRVLVPVDVELTWPANTPTKLHVTLFDGGNRLDSLVVTSPTCATGSVRRCRAVLQGELSAPTPTRKWLTVQVQVDSVNATKLSADSLEVVLVDRRTTMYGSGWWPAGVLKLVQAGSDRVLIGPTGTGAVYRGNGDSLYVAPPGDFSVLTKTGSGWTLSPRGSKAMLVFDANGRLVKSVDRNGNRDSIVYSGASDQVTSFLDAVGKTITPGYDGNGKLSTFTDPGGRQTKVSIDATTNQLTYDSLSSPASKAYTTTYAYQTYPGTGTVVLTQRAGVIGDNTVVTYDSTFQRRPVQVTLPQVQDENGNPVNPVITYTAYERQGYGALRSLDSVYVELKDPRTNWTRSLVNRWGEARKTWDALGLIGRTEYTPEGFALWSEGKVADSSRVYHTYDALRRRSRSYIVRAVGDTLRLDSLVYDGNHRVIRSIGTFKDTTRVSYDANGNVISTTSPSGAVTQYGYRSDGLLSALQLPGAAWSQLFAYDATWKNRARALDESGAMVDSAVFDGLGRDTAELKRVRVQLTNTATMWQWRRIQRYYNAAGQTDSTWLLRTDNCTPCTSPPAWPSHQLADSAKTRHVGYVFDRAGRDSLRINDRGKATMYVFDRLGRLVSRRPWTDSMQVKDSLVYDVAGNLKKTLTRRGDALTGDYDSRNRDTLSVIPGVGTLRKAFAGPLDQLTRLWYDNQVDSIGGVNAELRWGYDQRGRLKTDTSFTGTGPQGTSYSYDSYERRSTTTDPLGLWTFRYEGLRGYPDSLITPYADTVTYTFDVQDRAVGPHLYIGNVPQSREPTWNETGELDALVHMVATSPSYTGGDYERSAGEDESGHVLGPVWTEQHGMGQPLDSLTDSLTYDAWERVTAVVARKFRGSWSVVARDTFQFDMRNNIRTTAGAEVYDIVTDRLTARSDASCGTWSYGYDRAGNLVTAVCGTKSWAYAYDALNRLRAVRYNSTLIARYGYDVVGRRIAKRVYANLTGGTIAYTRFVYHGGSVAFETDSLGTTIGLRYMWGLGRDALVAIHDAGTNEYYAVLDKLGSVRGLVKRDGTWVMSQRVGPYGATIARDTNSAAPPPVLRYGWTGREYDAETGWYFFRARYFDPAVRRYVQEDAIGYGGGSNLYAYAEGGPLEGRDPSGLRSASIDILNFGGAEGRALPSLGGGGGGDDPWGQETDQAFADLTWDAQQSGLTVTQLDYYRSIGADVVWTKTNDGSITFHHVPQTNSVFVDRPVTMSRAYAIAVGAAIRAGAGWDVTAVASRPPDPLGEVILGYDKDFAKAPLPPWVPAEWTSQFFEGFHVLEGTWTLTWSRGALGRYDLENGRYDGYRAYGYIEVFHGIFLGVLYPWQGQWRL